MALSDLALFPDDCFRGMEAAKKAEEGGDRHPRLSEPRDPETVAVFSGKLIFHLLASELMMSMQRAANWWLTDMD